MAKGRFATLTSWSFSTYTQYIKCPFSVCLEKIQRIRVQEPDNPHLVHGNKAHEAADGVITGRVKAPPKITTPMPGRPALSSDLKKIGGQLTQLRAAKAKTEQEWAFDRQWNPVDWRDWSRAWVRMKIDAVKEALRPPSVDIIDWKTGKVHDEHKQQRSLYATGGLQLVKLGALAGGDKKVKLTAQHVYLDTGQTATEEFEMKHLAPLRKEWEARTKEMLEDTAFKVRTGPHCRWCKFRKSAGGPCPEDQ